MQTPGASRPGSVLTYVILCTLIPFSGSLVYPVLSLYVTTELLFTPLGTSLLYILLPVTTVIVVQVVGRMSDYGLQRPLIVSVSCVAGICSGAFLMLRPELILMCTLGVLFLALSSVGFPQMFASAREFSLRGMRSSIMFTTFLRALCSLAWVIGPPVAYFIATGHSFNLLFILSALMYVVSGLIAFFFLPHIRLEPVEGVSAKENPLKSLPVLLLFIACAAMFTAFNSYIVTMPLYITEELKLDKSLPGYMMGLAAFLEIPIMLLAAKAARVTGLKSIVVTGGVCLVLFLVCMIFAKDARLFLALQILSALFIGLVGSMGMVYFQELLPTIPGQSTSLFINAGTAGQIAGGALIAFSALGSYRYIFMAGLAFALVSLVVLIFVKKPASVR